MSASTNEHVGDVKTPENERICEVEATVVTGFEHVAREDVRKRLGCTVKPVRGKIVIFVPFEDLPKVR